MNRRGEASVQEISNLGLYQNRINRVLKDAEQRLGEAQAQRKAAEEERKAEAIRLYQLSKMNGLPWAPEDFGFVYSAGEMEREVRRRKLLQLASEAARWDYDRAKVEAAAERGVAA
jgi:hypothetical protein